jgi:hypothetical protein
MYIGLQNWDPMTRSEHELPKTAATPDLAALSYIFPPVALQSLKDLGRLTYRRFLELF